MRDKSSPEKRSVVVTGASKGIGEACVLHLDCLNFRIFAGVRQQLDGERLKQKTSDRVIPVLIDVTDPASIASAVTLVAPMVEETGLVGLINNAGISIAGPLEFLPITHFRKQLEVNVIGQLSVIQAFLPLLRKGRGRIINMGSIAGRNVVPFLGPYAASKFALEALTDALRMELQHWGIFVSIIEPGGIATPIWETSIAAGDELAENLPPEAHRLYGRAFQAIRRAAVHAAETSIPAERVAKLVSHVLTTGSPKTRYLLGPSTRLQAMLQLLPDRIRDRIMVRYLLSDW